MSVTIIKTVVKKAGVSPSTVFRAVKGELIHHHHLTIPHRLMTREWSLHSIHS